MLYDESTQAIIGDRYIDMYGNIQTITDGGDASHPSDAGMRLIADKIIESIFAERDASSSLKYKWTVENGIIAKVENTNTTGGANNVSSNAVVGSSRIFAEVKDNGVTYTASTIVNVNGSGGTDNYTMTIAVPSWTALPISQVRMFTVYYNPVEFEDFRTVTWSSSNTTVATIDQVTGAVTGKSAGTTTITASDGVKSATYTLNVNGLLGDYDNDTYITSFDAYKTLLFSVNQGTNTQEEADKAVIADVDRDGEITSWDAYRILVYSVGSITEF